MDDIIERAADESTAWKRKISVFMLLILVALVGYLTFVPVPDSNKDIIITVLGVILGGGAAAMPNLFGDRNTETDKLRERVKQLEQQRELMYRELETVKDHYDRILEMLIERHIQPDVQPVSVKAMALPKPGANSPRNDE